MKNLKFTLRLENTVMGSILFDGMEPPKAAETWLQGQRQAWEPWLAGVTTFDGKPGLEAVQEEPRS